MNAFNQKNTHNEANYNLGTTIVRNKNMNTFHFRYKTGTGLPMTSANYLTNCNHYAQMIICCLMYLYQTNTNGRPIQSRRIKKIKPNRSISGLISKRKQNGRNSIYNQKRKFIRAVQLLKNNSNPIGEPHFSMQFKTSTN